MIKLRETAS